MDVRRSSRIEERICREGEANLAARQLRIAMYRVHIDLFLNSLDSCIGKLIDDEFDIPGKWKSKQFDDQGTDSFRVIKQNLYRNPCKRQLLPEDAWQRCVCSERCDSQCTNRLLYMLACIICIDSFAVIFNIVCC